MTKLCTAVSLALLAAACGSRTAAETQPAPASYKPELNDPKAVGIVDQVVANVGGTEAWAAVKQITWNQTINIDGERAGVFEHAWDRWNGRHGFVSTDVASLKRAEELNDPKQIITNNAMYNLFERDRGTANQNGREIPRDAQKKLIADAYKRWQLDGYYLTFVHKLKDPGVYLAYDGVTKDRCPGECDVIKVTFDPGVGNDTYFVVVDQATKMPVMIQIQLRGQQGVIAYALSDWTEAGGLKFPGKLENVGASESITFTNITIGDVDDALYIPSIH